MKTNLRFSISQVAPTAQVDGLLAQQSQSNKGKRQPGRVILVGEKDRQLARQRSQNGNRVSASLFINDRNELDKIVIMNKRTDQKIPQQTNIE